MLVQEFSAAAGSHADSTRPRKAITFLSTLETVPAGVATLRICSMQVTRLRSVEENKRSEREGNKQCAQTFDNMIGIALRHAAAIRDPPLQLPVATCRLSDSVIGEPLTGADPCHLSPLTTCPKPHCTRALECRPLRSTAIRNQTPFRRI